MIIVHLQKPMTSDQVEDSSLHTHSLEPFKVPQTTAPHAGYLS